MKITIEFNEQSTHEDVIQQFIDKLWLEGFCSKAEIIENMKIADILYNNRDYHSKKHNVIAKTEPYKSQGEW